MALSDRKRSTRPQAFWQRKIARHSQLTDMNLKDSIIAETENWVAINKPSGILSIPDRLGKDSSLKVLLKEKYGDIFTVHRIDRDTSGLIIFAKKYTI